MAEVFPRWANRVPRYLALGAAVSALSLTLGVWYYFSPEFTDVGYMPRQPVPFSHKLHAGELKMDCRYCHPAVELSAVASVPPTQTCMNCHQLVSRKSEKLAPVRASSESGEPIRWIRVHKVPEYAYFNHSSHLSAGIGCSSCHGDVAQMEETVQVEPLSMSWCLGCHRRPDHYLRPRDQITNTAWSTPSNQLAFAEELKKKRPIEPPIDCSGCHR